MHSLESWSEGKDEKNWLSSSGRQSMAPGFSHGYPLQGCSFGINRWRETSKIQSMSSSKPLCQPLPHQCFSSWTGSLSGHSYLLSWYVSFIHTLSLTQTTFSCFLLLSLFVILASFQLFYFTLLLLLSSMKDREGCCTFRVIFITLFIVSPFEFLSETTGRRARKTILEEDWETNENKVRKEEELACNSKYSWSNQL